MSSEVGAKVATDMASAIPIRAERFKGRFSYIFKKLYLFSRVVLALVETTAGAVPIRAVSGGHIECAY